MLTWEPRAATGRRFSVAVAAAASKAVTNEIFALPAYTIDGNGNNVDLIGYYGIPLAVFTPPAGFSM
jgi:hypothetical protein